MMTAIPAKSSGDRLRRNRPASPQLANERPPKTNSRISDVQPCSKRSAQRICRAIRHDGVNVQALAPSLWPGEPLMILRYSNSKMDEVTAKD